MRKQLFVTLSIFLVAVATLVVERNTSLPAPRRSAPLPQQSQARGVDAVVEAYGKLPLSFETNQGQTASEVKFLSRGNGYSIFLTSTEAVLALNPSRDSDGAVPQPRLENKTGPLALARGSDWLFPSRDREGAVTPATANTAVLRMKLVAANPSPQVTGLDELPGKSNYFLGNDPKQWRTNVPTYAKVRYENVYPGIDLVYYGNQPHGPEPVEGQQLEYDFIVAPGADPGAIRLDFTGAKKIEANADGDLALHLSGEEIHLRKPVVYQEVNGTRREVSGGYVLDARNTIGFQLAPYDSSRPLIIDPVLAYSLAFGGSHGDQGNAITVDGSGNAYITGGTNSTDFPTSNPFQSTFGGGGACCGLATYGDAFVTKINSTGTAIVYSTYLGGSGVDVAYGISLGTSGEAYVTGITYSTDFPTATPFQRNLRGTLDAFVTKLSASGSALAYSTYLGGNGDDIAHGIAVDFAGSAYVTGNTLSSDFPTANPLQSSFMGGQERVLSGGGDAFVTKLNPAGTGLVYSTYLGGSGDEAGIAIAVDSAGNAYVTGSSGSTDFPTVNAFQKSFRGGSASFVGGDAFVAKLNATGAALIFSTYLGGSSADGGSSIAIDSAGNAYVTGITLSTDFPTAKAFQPSIGGSINAFLTKLNPTGNALVYSTYIGGNNQDWGIGLGIDASANAIVVGFTLSANYPLVNPVQILDLQGSNGSAFVTKVNPAGSALVYSTYMGAYAAGIATDSVGNAYVTGTGGGSGFPMVGLFPATNGGGSGPFVAKIMDVPAPAPVLPPNSVVNGASFRLATDPNGAIAPGAIVAIFGTDLAGATLSAGHLPLPTTLMDTKVFFNDIPAPLFYVSNRQINVQVPFEIGPGPVLVKIQRGSATSSQTVSVAPFSPGIFTIAESGRANRGGFISIYGTGLGPVTNQPGSGVPAPDRFGCVVFPFQCPPLSITTTLPAVTIGGVSATVTFSGLAPTFVGLYQVNVQVPENAPAGNAVPVVLSIGGVTSNTVTIAVQPSLEAGLVAPSTVTDNLMPPLPPTVPVSVPVTVSLTNRGTASQTLTAATPCDVHTWTLTDLTDNVIQTEPPENCIQVLASRTIAPGETIAENSTVVLDGRLLRDKTSYKLKYRFWGVPSEATFVVQVVQ